MSTSAKLATIGITFTLSPFALDLIRSHFATVHYCPDGKVAPEVAREVEVWFTGYLGIPKAITGDMLDKTQIVQLTSAGANHAFTCPALQDPEVKKRVKVCTTSGIHVLSMPGYIIAQVIGFYQNIHTSIYITRAEHRWPRRSELALNPPPGADPNVFGRMGFINLRGKVVGMLGYGHIARETARLLKAFGCEIIAANTRGEKSRCGGYIIPGTGDVEGNVPTAWYSTTDPASFAQFLSRSQILIATLPSTPATRGMLTAAHLKLLPHNGIFINVGRGDLISSESLLEALDARADSAGQGEDDPKPASANGGAFRSQAPGESAADAEAARLEQEKPQASYRLLGVGLDVTDPEPLPKDHPLLSHPRVVLTPHVSADFEGYFDAGAELLVANVENVRKGGEPFNVVDPEKGY